MHKIVQYIPEMWKAITAGVAAGSSAFGIAQIDGVTWQEWVYVLAVGVAAGAATWKVENK